LTVGAVLGWWPTLVFISEPTMKFLVGLVLIGVPLSAQTVVFPLHVGDRWQYETGPITGPIYPGPSARVVGDTVLPGGKTFAEMLWDGGHTEFLRQSGDSVFLYDQVYRTEYLFYDFSRQPKDTVNTVPRGNDTMDIVLGSVFNGPPRIWWFAINPYRHFIDDEYSVEVQDSLGLTGVRPSFGDESSLTGALINGRVYGTIAGIRPPGPLLPGGFELAQNFPNPFNPTTTIRYALPQRSHVSLTVFNTLGQQVANLVNENQGAGDHDVRFDASALASGVYFYRLRAGEYAATKRLLLLR